MAKIQNPEELQKLSNEPVTDLESLQKQIDELQKLVNATGDLNKLKDYERSKEVLNNFSFTIKLYEEEDGTYPVISWKLKKNYVAVDLEGLKEDQRLEIVYLKDGKEVIKEIPLVEFSRTLKRSDSILAKSIKNEDGTNVYIEKNINKDSWEVFYLMKPTTENIQVTLDYNGTVITLSSKFLNA